MRGKVFLSGGGKSQETYILDEYFVKSLINNRILYIPIGLNRDIIGFEGCYEWITATLQPFSSVPLKIEMWVSLKKLPHENLNAFDAVYIGGASNTYRLMRLLRKDGIDILLRKYVLEGGIIYGGSSGGIVLGKSIETSGDDNQQNYSSEGLNIINGLSVYCHYNLSGYKNAKNHAEKLHNSVIAIPENSGVVYQNNKIKTYGLADVKIFYKSGKSFLLKPNQETVI
jgi:dipeptidase E